MNVNFYCFILTTCCSFVIFGNGTGKSLEDKTKREKDRVKKLIRKTEADTFLESFGYLRKNGLQHSRKERKNALREFQHNANLKETGKLNKATIKSMKKPRCGLSDVKHGRQKREAAKWYHQTVTWKHSGYTRKLSKLQQLRTFQKAFREWSKVISVRFRFTRKKPDIDIRFARYEHGDGVYNAFDGKGLVLAHAFLPGEAAASGDVHFDEDEDWSLAKRTEDSTDLMYIAVHEFGHAIGLDHSSNRDSVMSPYQKDKYLKLDPTDVINAQRIYGKPNDYSRYIRPTYPSVVTTRPENSINLQLNTASLNDGCKGIDDLFLGKDGYMHVFAKNLLFNINETHGRQGYPIMLNQNYSGVPSFIDAAEYVPKFNRTYIFKGHLVWRYTNNILDFKFPKPIKGQRTRERARTAVAAGKRMFIFGKHQFWEWNLKADTATNYNMLSITKYWKGVPNAPDAAMKKDGFLYFIKDNRYYKVHPKLRRVMLGYPKQMPMPWLRSLC